MDPAQDTMTVTVKCKSSTKPVGLCPAGLRCALFKDAEWTRGTRTLDKEKKLGLVAGLRGELPWRQLTKQLWGGGKCQHSVETVDSQITLSIYRAFEAHELSRILQANLGIQVFFSITQRVNDNG